MIIARAPLRVSFFGGGSDYPEYFARHGGAVLATAIDKYSYVTASTFFSRLFDYGIRLSYRNNELVRTVDEIQHAVFRECLRRYGPAKDIELHTVADLPAFTGLGSSSSFTVALILALRSFQGSFTRPLDLAYRAIDMERNVLKDRVGCQDQVLAAVGGFNLVEFRAEDDILVHRVPLTAERLASLEQHLFVVYSGIQRRAAEVVASQLKRVDDNNKTLKQMTEMAYRGWDILTGDGPIEAFGELLHDAWMAKRSLDASITRSEIDEIYNRGRDAGALGGKLLGAGGGGFVLFFAPPERHQDLSAAFASHQLLPVRVNAPGAEIIFS